MRDSLLPTRKEVSDRHRSHRLTLTAYHLPLGNIKRICLRAVYSTIDDLDINLPSMQRASEHRGPRRWYSAFMTGGRR